jgi:hypothetical protein
MLVPGKNGFGEVLWFDHSILQFALIGKGPPKGAFHGFDRAENAPGLNGGAQRKKFSNFRFLRASASPR